MADIETPKVEQRFHKIEELKADTYDGARVEYDRVLKQIGKSTSKKVRVRKRQVGYEVVTYGLLKQETEKQT
jgi:hypothetical protein